eukprot:COSAG04_NODE_10432_length_778_cov_0.804124_1_plen_29_part_10
MARRLGRAVTPVSLGEAQQARGGGTREAG